MGVRAWHRPAQHGPWPPIPRYLGVRGASFLPDEQEVALAIDRHLTLELTTWSRREERGKPSGSA